MSALTATFHRAVGAAAGLTGRRFGLLVASSIVATSAIVASAITSPDGAVGPLAALLGRSMASESTPVEEPTPGGPSQPADGPVEPAHSSGRGSTESTGGPPAAATSNPPSAGGPETEPEETENTTPTPTPEAGRVKHVFMVSIASPGYEASFGEGTSQMPYLSETLRPTGELLSKYTLLTEAALPNELAAIGGQAPTDATKDNCPKFDCLYPATTFSLADQLGVGRFTWHAYLEGMVDESGKPANCVYPGPGESQTPPTGGYAVWQNPFAYFHSLLDLGDCAVNDEPLEALTADLKKADTASNFSYIAPNLCNAGIPGQCSSEGALEGAAAADAFLAEWVPKIVSSPAFEDDGLLIVAFNQLARAPGATAGKTPPRQVGALLVSPFAAPGATDTAPYVPYSLLRSVEDLFGLGRLGAAGHDKVRSFAGPLLGEAGAGD